MPWSTCVNKSYSADNFLVISSGLLCLIIINFEFRSLIKLLEVFLCNFLLQHLFQGQLYVKYQNLLDKILLFF